MAPVLADYDDAVATTVLGIVYGSPPCLLSTALYQSSGPDGSGPTPGCGLLHAADYARSAWIHSLAACLSDVLLFSLRRSLGTHVRKALSHLQEGLAEDRQLAQEFVPLDADKFLDGSIFNPTAPVPKINKPLMKMLRRRKLNEYMALFDADVDAGGALTEADIVDGTARSSLGRIFAAPLSHRPQSIPLDGKVFRAFCCFFLGLPPFSS